MLADAGITTGAELVACTEADLRSRAVDDRAIVDITEILAMHAVTLNVVDVAAPSQLNAATANFAEQESALFAEPEPFVEQPDHDELLGSAIAEDDIRELERVFSTIELRKKRAVKPTTLTDDRRANAFAERVAGSDRRKSARPNRDDARIAELREKVTLTVDEVAFLYNVSRDAVYDALNRPGSSIPHTRIGKRFVIPTRHVFEALGLS
jgi:hypothetical protein